MKKTRLKAIKKILFVIVITVLQLSIFGCKKNLKDDGKIHIVCTTFPQYDWVREIVGDSLNVEVTLLADSGTDLHSYQPTAEDIVTISDCDLFIYVGGESDGWVEDALAQKTNKDRIDINLIDVLGDKAKEETLVEGMEGEEEQDASSEEEEEIEYDEHIWLSLKNAEFLCDNICNQICELDEENKDTYVKNKDEYVAKLAKLDAKYAELLTGAKFDTVLFGDRFPFMYMMSDYNIKYYAAFVGCSAETEASFETVAFLANKMDELKLPVILVCESSDKSLADTIVSETKSKKAEVLVMDSLQSVTKSQLDDGKNYYDVMYQNYETLVKALGK